MYRIPHNLNLDDIVNSQIQKICLGRYQVDFQFGSGRLITVYGNIEIFDQKTLVASWNEKSNWSTTTFQKLLNINIVSYEVINDRLLGIRFEGNLELHLHDSSDQYESIEIFPEIIII